MMKAGMHQARKNKPPQRRKRSAKMHINEPEREKALPASSKARIQGVKRVVRVLLGGTLVGVGIARRSLGGGVIMLLGGSLLYRGLKPRVGEAPSEEVAVQCSATIAKPALELYRLWKAPETLPQLMAHFADISVVGDGHLHWVLHGPLGKGVVWDSQVTEQRPGELLRLAALPGARHPVEIEVRFHPAPADRGTEVTMRVQLAPQGSVLGAIEQKLLQGLPQVMMRKALRRFKSLAEAGEIPTLELNPSARKSDQAS